MDVRKMLVQHYASQSPNPVNEDIGGFGANSAWILDGASSISKRQRKHLNAVQSDAAWFVQEFSARLSIHDRPEGVGIPEFRQIAAEIWEQIPLIWDVERGSLSDPPSASFSHIAIQGSVAKLYNLGDCKVLWRGDRGEIHQFGTSHVGALDTKLLAAFSQLRTADPTLAHAQIASRLVESIRRNRSLMNTVGGYWILTPDGAGIAFGEQHDVVFKNSFEAALVSDGLWRLVDVYQCMSPEQFFDEVTAAQGVEALITRLRKIEDSDPEAVRYPRLKLRDDATAVTLKHIL